MTIKTVFRSLNRREVGVKLLRLMLIAAVCATIIFQWRNGGKVQTVQDALPEVRETRDSSKQNNVGPPATLQGKSIVLLVADQRSGSTVVGEIFNQNPSAFYLFEPLFPFSKSCEILKNERVHFLAELLECNLNIMPQTYEHAFGITKFNDKDAECVKHNLCFVTSHKPLLKKYASLCKASVSKSPHAVDVAPANFNPESKTCGFPLNTTLMREMCTSSDVIAVKVLRLCSLQSIAKMYSELTNQGLKVFVVHLVRDPRAIIASRVDLRIDGIRFFNVQPDIKLLCDKYRANIGYVEELKQDNSSFNFISSGRYLRVRHEDFTVRPRTISEHIYKFIGKEMPKEVVKFIYNSHQSTSLVMDRIEREDEQAIREKKEISEYTKNKQILRQMSNPFGTVRDPAEVLRKWRLQMPYESMQQVQKQCGDVLARLGYKVFNSKVDLVNITMKFY